MHERIAAVEADARREGVGDGGEDVEDAAAVVGSGESLERWGARREPEVERAAGDLTGDGVGLREIPLGVVAADRDRRALDVAAIREPLDHAGHGVVEQRRAHLLEHGHRGHRAVRTGPVGREQKRGGAAEQEQRGERSPEEAGERRSTSDDAAHT